MTKLVLRGFLQRKLRVLLTGIAIALGVALMAGTYILTDTINQSFAGIFQTANSGNSVVISPAAEFDIPNGWYVDKDSATVSIDKQKAEQAAVKILDEAKVLEASLESGQQQTTK